MMKLVFISLCNNEMFLNKYIKEYERFHDITSKQNERRRHLVQINNQVSKGVLLRHHLKWNGVSNIQFSKPKSFDTTGPNTRTVDRNSIGSVFVWSFRYLKVTNTHKYYESKMLPNYKIPQLLLEQRSP